MVELRRRRHAGRRPATITGLAEALGYTRETVSRALNQGEFPEVSERIRTYLKL
ncbi:MAG TPA: hypothetical protein PKY38_08905 [Opitutaceae bacterium]|nr:hypothetical protein [Opitutaceae bacterium]